MNKRGEVASEGGHLAAVIGHTHVTCGRAALLVRIRAGHIMLASYGATTRTSDGAAIERPKWSPGCSGGHGGMAKSQSQRRRHTRGTNQDPVHPAKSMKGGEGNTQTKPKEKKAPVQEHDGSMNHQATMQG